jgi:hypothetical protein
VAAFSGMGVDGEIVVGWTGSVSTPLTAAHASEVTLNTVADAVGNYWLGPAICLHNGTGGYNGYVLRCTDIKVTGNNTFRLMKMTDGVASEIANFNASAADGKRARLEVTYPTADPRLEIFFDDVTHSNHTDTGGYTTGTYGFAIKTQPVFGPMLDKLDVGNIGSVAPVLTSPTGTKTGAKTGSGTVSTNTGSGTLYYYASTNSTESVATIKASGASQAVSGTGSQSVSFTGLTSNTTYYAHYAHNAAGQDSTAANSTPGFLTDPLFSNVVNSGSILTDSPAATGVTLSGPTSGVVGSPSTNFSVGVTPGGGTITGTLVVTPSSGGGGGTFSPTSINLTTGSPTGTFTYTAASVGTKTISVTNDGGLTNPGNISYDASAAPATAVTISGPNSGTNGIASTNFTVGANGVITGTVTVTPSSGGGGGTFTPTTVNISSGSPTATFTYTPASIGTKSITVTNNGSLSNPSAWTYTVDPVGGIATLNDWVNNAGTSYPNGELVNISFHNTTSRALVYFASNVTINSGADLVVTNVALISGTTYAWFAESPTNSTWFASGRVTIA